MPIRIRTPWHSKVHADRTQNMTATFISSLGDTTLITLKRTFCVRCGYPDHHGRNYHQASQIKEDHYKISRIYKDEGAYLNATIPGIYLNGKPLTNLQAWNLSVQAEIDEEGDNLLH